MLREPTLEKLHALRLRVLAGTWLEQDKSADTLALAFDERLALLVDAEMLARENARLARNLREAKLRIADACIEGIDFRASASSTRLSCDSSRAAVGSTSIRP